MYVFMYSGGLGVVRCYESLSAVCGRAGLEQPQKITSVNLRKYMATVTQVKLKLVFAYYHYNSYLFGTQNHKASTIGIIKYKQYE